MMDGGILEETFGAGPRPPAFPELELALVGAVLSENVIFERVASIVSADDFTDPLLVVVWEEIANTIRAVRGQDFSRLSLVR